MMTRTINYNNINGEDVSSLYKGVKIETLSNVTINNVEFNYKKYNLIKYNGKCNPEDKSNGILRSVVARENGKILAVDQKTFKVDEFIKRGNEATSNVTSKDVRIEQYISGPKIRLFYDEMQKDDERSEWVVCTKSNIGANNRYFVDAGASVAAGTNESTSTYQKMFIEACDHTGLKYLDVLPKHLQYMFVMKHPKNITVCNVEEPELHLIGVNEITKDNQVIIHSLESVAEHFKNTKVQFPKIISECNINDVAKLSSDYLLDNQLSVENYNNHEYPTYKEEGIMFIHKNTFEFSKCINPQYEMVKSILGNQPKMEFRYAELWSDTVMNAKNDDNENKLTLFIKYFPEFSYSYKTFNGKMSQFLNNVYSAYIDCFIHKMKPLKEFPFQYRPHLFEIHNLYKNELRPNGKHMSLPIVFKYFANLPTAKTMFALNYEYRL